MGKKRNSVQKTFPKKSLNDVNSEKYKYILAASFFIFIFLFTTFKISGDDDVFWHLKTGKYIIEHKTVPSTDVFGFMTYGDEWIPFEWGWDVITYFIYLFSGYTGILLFRTIIILIIFYFVFRQALKLGLNVWLPVLVSVILIFGMMDRIIPKPQIISYLFLSILLYVLISLQTFNRENINIIYFLPLIFFLWSNMHMGSLAGAGIFTIFFVSELFIYFSGNKKLVNPLSKDNLRKLSLVYVLSILVFLVNPNGINTYLYVYSHLNMKMLEDVFEWYSPFNKAFAGSMNQYIYIIFLLASLYIMYSAYKKRNYFTGFTALILVIFSLNSGRYTVDFMLVASILFLYTASNISAQKLSKYSKFVYPATGVILISLIILLPSNRLYSFINYERSFGFGVDERYYPAKLVEFIRSNNIHITGMRPFNSFAMGGYFIWELDGAKNFIDSRNLSDIIYYNYKTINNKLPGFEAKLEENNFDYIAWFYPFLVQNTIELKTSVVSYLLSKPEKWRLVYWDDHSCLFVKNEEKFREIIERYEYKYVNPLYYIHEREPLKKALAENTDGVFKEIQRKYMEEPDGSFINSMVRSFKVPVNR